MCAGSLPLKRLQKINPIVITDRDWEGSNLYILMSVCVNLVDSPVPATCAYKGGLFSPVSVWPQAWCVAGERRGKYFRVVGMFLWM